MTIKFNDQQLDIIHSIDTNTMVSASAGAGKTTVLIGRLIKRILEDRISINQIVAMTFTEKAAAEMKNRLYDALGRKLKDSPEDAYLKEQFTLLASAQISTIHSFCLGIIKEFGYLQGIDPERTTRIFDDQETQQLMSESVQIVLDYLIEKYQHSEDFINLLNFFNFRIVDYNDFSKAFIKLSQTAQSNLNPINFYDSILNLYDTKSFNDYPQELKKIFFKYGQVHIERLQQDLDAMQESFYQSEIQDETFYNQLQEHISIVHSLNQLLKQEDLDAIVSLLTRLLSIKMKQVNKTEYSKMRKDYYSKTGLEAVDYFARKQDLSSSKPYIEILVEAAQMFEHNFSILKEQHRGLDFDDIEKLAYQLLSVPSENNIVVETLKSRYEEILVDEFQDSNYFQNEIVQLIARKNNVFRVGDTKQSIYGFRNAKPSLMKDIMNLDNTPNHKTLYLSKNFRSSYNIVEFNNILFKNLMNIPGSSLSYDDLDRVEIGLDKQKDNRQPVEIILLDPKQPFDYTGFSKPQESAAQRISYFIAQDIKRKVNSQKAQYKDICVLIRSHNRKTELKRAFDDLNIPYYIEDKEGFYHSYSVQDITHFIKFLLDPSDNHALTWVLLSGFVNYSEEQLGQLYLVNKYNSLFSNLNDFDSELYVNLKKMIRQFYDLEPHNFINLLLTFNNYYLEHLNTQERTNVDLYCQRLQTYFSKPHTGYLGFIKQVELAKDLQSSNASSISEDENVVRVYTLHQAKGLEYPLVYFFSFKSDNKDQDIKSKISFDSDLGVSMNLLDFNQNQTEESLFDSIFDTHKQIESIQEEIRNLYVALTRPKNHLLIVDLYREADYQEISLNDLIAGDNYIKLILKSLSSVNSDVYEIHNLIQLEPIIVEQKKPLIKHQAALQFQPFQEQEEELDIKQEWTLKLNLQSHYATDYGTLMHEIIQKLPHRSWDYDDLDAYPEDIQTKLMTFNQNELTQEFYQFPIEHEVAISYLKDNQIFYGYMDMVVKMNNTIVMVDYKTDLVHDEIELLNRYQKQMDDYYEGLKKVYPNQKIEQYLYSFDLNTYIYINR